MVINHESENQSNCQRKKKNTKTEGGLFICGCDFRSCCLCIDMCVCVCSLRSRCHKECVYGYKKTVLSSVCLCVFRARGSSCPRCVQCADWQPGVDAPQWPDGDWRDGRCHDRARRSRPHSRPVCYWWYVLWRWQESLTRMWQSRDSYRAGIAHWLECPTPDQKVAGSSPCRSGGGIFLLQGQLSLLSLISVSVPQKHVKDRGHSANSAGGRLQRNTYAPNVCAFEWSDCAYWSECSFSSILLSAASCCCSRFSSLQFRMVSLCSGRPIICDPACL